MHRYKQIEYKAGATLEIIKCIPRGCRKGVPRSPVKKKTKEEMMEANVRQAARKLARKINANFKPGDWHLVLTYRRENRPDRKEAKKKLDKFLEKAREEFKKSGFQLKYISATEYKKAAIHHHLIINNINDGQRTTTDIVRNLWKGMGNIKLIPLYEDGEYQHLADYLIKETEETFREADSPSKQRYSCSRNLIIPKPEYRMRKAKAWKKEPRPRDGYYILPDSLYNGHDKLGYPYQRYVMVRINPSEADWEPGIWTEEGGG